jgi:hypothetical protein
VPLGKYLILKAANARAAFNRQNLPSKMGENCPVVRGRGILINAGQVNYLSAAALDANPGHCVTVAL